MFSTTTPTQIRDNPLNSSTAKNHWSFSKAPRFKDPKANCNRSSYETSSSLSARRASIGYGTRSTYFDGRKDTIDPGNYKMTSSFDLGKSGAHKKGYSFSNNRDELSFSNYLTIGEKTPAPAQYKVDAKSVKKSYGAYSMRPKTSYPKNYFLLNDSQIQTLREEPGPGRYEAVDFLGSPYKTSASKNAMGSSFVGKDRFAKEKRTPGPGDYNYNPIHPDGQYLLSTMRGSGRRKIMQEKRQLKLEGNDFTPGPGSYRQPSDFGHYQSNYRAKTARR